MKASKEVSNEDSEHQVVGLDSDSNLTKDLSDIKRSEVKDVNLVFLQI